MTDPIHSHRWRKLQQKILERDDRTCYVCGGVAITVDHILPRDSRPDLMWDEDNLKAMCVKHNSSKGAKINTHRRSNWVDEEWFPEGIPER